MAKYVNRMREKMRDRAKARMDEQRGGGTTLRLPEGYTDVEFYKVKGTRVELDIVPYVVTVKDRPDNVEKGELWHTRRYYTHRNVGSDEQSYICPKATAGLPCPICEYAAAQRKRGADREVLKELRPRARDLFNIVDLDDDGKIKVWDVSAFLFGDKLNTELMDSDDPDNDGFADLQDGRTLKLRFEKKSFNKNDFYAIDRIDFKPRKAYKESILDEVVDLDKMLVIPTYEELERLFYMEEAAPAREEEPEEESPRPRRGRTRDDEDEEKPRGRRAKDEEDEEPEEEEAPRPRRSRKVEEEPEEKPRRGRSRSKEEDSDDDEPEEKPRSRRSKDDDDEEPPRPKRGSEDNDDDEEKPRPRRNRDKDSKECPGGGTFGKDNDKFDECDDCKLWGECNRIAQG